MLGAVTQEAPGYEGLRNYVVNGGRPTAVPAFDASARQPMGAPGSALPGAPTPIPTSSARPGKMTNQRITYARLMTKYPSPADGGLDPDGIHEGDIAFVHRYDGLNSGYDTNKPTCMATLAQLNRIFKDYTPSTSDLGTMVMAARDANGNANDPRGVTEPPEEPPPPAPPAGNRPDPPTAAWVAHDAAMDAYRSSAQVAEYHREKVLYEKDYPKYRWRHCVALSQWTLDGVCCATEHEHTKDPMVGQGASNPGELFNIAIGGPTLVRNAANPKHNMHVPEQHIDDGARTLDKVFVGLVCYEVRDTDEQSPTHRQVTHYMYQYKPSTSRQIAWAAFQRHVSGVAPAPSYGPVTDAIVPGAVNSTGPTVGDFQRMCCVWRLGSVLDTRAGMAPYKCATLNVVVEEWALEKLREEYNRFFGESLYLAPVPTLEDLALIATAAGHLGTLAAPSALVTNLRAAHARLQDWMRVDGIQLSRVAADVRAWRAVDRNWANEQEVLRMRWQTSDVDPNDPRNPDTRVDRYGNVVRRPNLARPRVRDVPNNEPRVEDEIVRDVGVFLYEPASPDSRALHAHAEQDAATTALRDAIVGYYPSDSAAMDQLRTIGRCAALTDATGYDNTQRATIRLADEAHAHWMGIRAAAAFWTSVQDAAANPDLQWPL